MAETLEDTGADGGDVDEPPTPDQQDHEQSPTSRQLAFGWLVTDVLVNLVVLNLAAEFVSPIVVERFSISIFVAVVLTLILYGIEWVEHRIQHFFCVERDRKIIGAFFMWLVVFSSKFVFLWLDDVIFGSNIELGGFVEIMLLSAVLMASEKITKILWNKMGQWDRARLENDDKTSEDLEASKNEHP